MSDGACILVLDDDATYVEVLTRALHRRGLQVLTATDCNTALALAKATPPDYAVVDLKIARESGLDMVGPLLALRPGMRILILTGYSSIATAVNAIKAGAFDYACKPLDTDEILQKLALANPLTPTPSSPPNDPISIDRLEWEHIQRILAENAGNISATARSLGMHRRTLQRKLQKRPVRQ